MQAVYDPYTNYFLGLLGWNIDFGEVNITTLIFISTTYGVNAILGGGIMTSGQFEEFIKEIEGRRLDLGDVVVPAQGVRLSMMNNNPIMPTEKDRAYIKLILLNQIARFDSGKETYSLDFLTNEDPNNEKSSNSTYKDIPGTKPYCMKYFNQEKFQEQLDLMQK